MLMLGTTAVVSGAGWCNTWVFARLMVSPNGWMPRKTCRASGEGRCPCGPGGRSRQSKGVPVSVCWRGEAPEVEERADRPYRMQTPSRMLHVVDNVGLHATKDQVE